MKTNHLIISQISHKHITKSQTKICEKCEKFVRRYLSIIQLFISFLTISHCFPYFLEIAIQKRKK
jgi:hypothetical protein